MLTLINTSAIPLIDPDFEDLWVESLSVPTPGNCFDERDMQEYQFMRLARWHDRVWSE